MKKTLKDKAKGWIKSLFKKKDKVKKFKPNPVRNESKKIQDLRKNRTNTQVVKKKNTDVKKKSTELKKTRANNTKNKKKSTLLRDTIIGGTIALAGTAANKMFSDDAASVPKKKKDFGNPGVGNEVKKGPKKSTGNPGVGNEIKGKGKGSKVGGGGMDIGKTKKLPKKSPVKTKKKSKSNISNSSSYDASFTKKGLEKRGLKAKNFMSDKNYKSATSKEAKTLSMGGKASKYYSAGGTVFTGR